MRRPNIYRYVSHREYLKDLFDFIKQTSKTFTFRQFSKRSGLSSPNYVQTVIKGSRNMSIMTIEKLAAGLKLNQQESDYFQALVLFNQAKTIEERNRFFQRLKKLRATKKIKLTDQDAFEFYSSWYHSAIRELVTLSYFQEDPEWIAQSLRPKISAQQAKKSLELLLRLKFLERDEQGKLRQAQANISTRPEVGGLAILNYHKEMGRRGLESLNLPGKERDVSAVTLGVSEARLQEIKRRIYEFRNELLETYGEMEESPDRVYQLNLQLFPMNEKKD